MKITIIIPLRITENVYQAKDRLTRIISKVPAEKFNILIVDYGTPVEFLHALSEIESEAVTIIRYEAGNRIFSIGHARDIGVQHAPDAVVIFHDIDFFCDTLMYERIYLEVNSRDMINNAYDFFCIPVFFLSEAGSRLILEMDQEGSISSNKIHRHLFELTPGITDFPAYGSSAIVVNKYHYLGIGGHSREFFGHGAEDYDVLHRLGSYYKKGPRTADYYLDTKTNHIAEYKGFRAYFSLYGLDVFSKGIFQVHLWHPKRIISGYQQSNRNFAILTDLMKKFDRNKDQPMPLADLSKNTKSLALVDQSSKTFMALRHALPLFGELNLLTETTFKDGKDLINYCNRNNIKNVIFLNPYGNKHRLELYQSVRNTDIGFYVFDRGALVDSWFFDPNGFNYDSKSYLPEMWNLPLSNDKKSKIDKYIFDLVTGENALEDNGTRKSGQYLRESLKIGAKQVLFVPFQRPSDTVVKYFSGAVDGVADFQSWLTYLSENLSKSDWIIICKNHPLERDLEKIDGVLYVKDDTHINDLLDLADKVLLMNSGVGLLASAFKKPVICVSNAFYAHEGIAWTASSKEEMIELVNKDLHVDYEKVQRFYSYLVNNFYSFGKSSYVKTKADDGSDRKIIHDIQFKNICLPNVTNISLGEPPRGTSLDAPLFYSFGGRTGIKNACKPLPISKPAPEVKKILATPPKDVVNKSTSIPDSKQLVKVLTTQKPTTSMNKKLNKLLKSPKMFFTDMYKNKTEALSSK